MDWKTILEAEQQQDYFKNLMTFLDKEYQKKNIFPPRNELFSCFQACDYEDVSVVIIGQDPYHGIGQAHGLCFSVKPGVKLPPSLKNIYKELESDVGITPSKSGYLMSWAKQGVLMMNAVMSVEEGKAASHRKKGWEIFTDHIMMKLNEHEKPLVFILWGNYAIDKAKVITNPKHLLIKGVHPSPLSAYHGFFGSKPFSACNEFLKANNRAEIDWHVGDEGDV